MHKLYPKEKMMEIEGKFKIFEAKSHVGWKYEKSGFGLTFCISINLIFQAQAYSSTFGGPAILYEAV